MRRTPLTTTPRWGQIPAEEQMSCIRWRASPCIHPSSWLFHGISGCSDRHSGSILPTLAVLSEVESDCQGRRPHAAAETASALGHAGLQVSAHERVITSAPSNSFVASSSSGLLSGRLRTRYVTTRYDTWCYFNVRSKADTSQLNLPHGNDNYKV